jgi:membrane protease YdiL (CAAX protease family)
MLLTAPLAWFVSLFLGNDGFEGFLAIASMLYATIGLVFGYHWPRNAWQWGLLESIPNGFFAILSNVRFDDVVKEQPGIGILLILHPLLAGCLGAYGGAGIRALRTRKEGGWERENKPVSAQDNAEATVASGSTQSAEALLSQGKASWKIGDIFHGLSIFLCWAACELSISYLQFFVLRPWFSIPLIFLVHVCLFVALAVFAVCICRKRAFWPMLPPLTLSLFWREFLRSIWYVLVISVCLMPAYAILEHGFKLEPTSKADLYLHSAPGGPLFILFLILGFTLGPIAEELFFRGFLYNVLKSRVRIALAIAIQAGIFALCHMEGVAYSIIVLLIGVALAIIYEKRKTLLTPIIVHIIKNGFVFVPLLVLAFQNYHVPAKTWEEARVNPHWFQSVPSGEIAQQIDGTRQWQYAIDMWGSTGSRHWKKEANAFNAVCVWFPENRVACAKARASIAAIYGTKLSDYRRSIVEAEKILREYPDQAEQCAFAWQMKGWSYYLLQDFKNSRDSFSKVIAEYKGYKKDYDSARKGIGQLDMFENRTDG